MSLLVLCPSHKRPREAGQVLATFVETVQGDTKIVFPIGIKDSQDYGSLPILAYPEMPMVQRTNLAATSSFALGFDYIGWIADDNRFETLGWDLQVVEALKTSFIVYGNDCVDPGSKPSHVFMDNRIVGALDWLCHPRLVSTYGDDAWEAIGRGLGTLRYLPDVKIRHLYREKDNSKNFIADGEAFQHWVRHDLENDLVNIRRALKLKAIPFVPDSLAAMTPPLILDPRHPL